MKETSSYTELYGEGLKDTLPCPSRREGERIHPDPFPLTRLPVAFPCLGREINIGWLGFSRVFLSINDRMLFNVSSDEVQWMIL